jgi:hypothetical protein
VTQDAQPGLNQVRIPVGRDWGNGAYVVATLLRPLDVAASRMPGRAIGVRWFAIDRAAKTLAVELQAPQLIRPETRLRVPVKINELAGEEARIAVAAVDVGILNLTNYKPPAPDDYYLGQRKFSADIRDLRPSDRRHAGRGQLHWQRYWGAKAASTQPVALYSGIDGRAQRHGRGRHDIPASPAPSGDGGGRRGQGRTVRRRDCAIPSADRLLPRFLLTGDRSTMQLGLDNVEGEAATIA